MSANGFLISHDDRSFDSGPVSQMWIDPRVGRAQALMRQNLHRHLRLGEVAGTVAMSTSRLSHLFKIQTGVSPACHLKRIRLQKAEDLLENSSLSIKEISAAVGLDFSRFVRVFREAYGVTPRQHRLRAWRSGLLSPATRTAGFAHK